MKLIAKALLDAQKEMGNAKKDSTNPFFKSKYADLNSVREACLPSLNNNGISVLQPITHIDGKNFVKTILLHESGESMESLTEIVYSKQNDAQAQGSGITYARRYGLQSFVNIGADDDDGNAAVKIPDYSKEIKKIKECTVIKDLETLYKSFDKQTQVALKNEVSTKKSELEKLELYRTEAEKQKQTHA